MPSSQKISPAFDPFLSDRDGQARREAVVIYQVPGSHKSGLSGPGLNEQSANLSRLGRRPLARGSGERSEIRRRLIARQVDAQRQIETQILKRYQARSRGVVAGPPPLSRSIGLGSLPAATVEVTRHSLKLLAQEPDVLAVLPNQTVHLIEPKAIDYRELMTQEAEDSLTWGLKQLDIAKAWETTKGAGVTVAVLDSGVYGDHPALKDRIKDFIVVDPLGRRIATQPSFDSGQHGTHVCGTIAGGKTEDGVSIGVAPEANLLVAGVLVGNATLATLMEGIGWAVENGADIINMSLGLEYYEPLFGQILDVLISQYDVLPVVAIGNSNHGNTSSPGSSYNAFAVGALEKLEPSQAEQSQVEPDQPDQPDPDDVDAPPSNEPVEDPPTHPSDGGDSEPEEILIASVPKSSSLTLSALDGASEVEEQADPPDVLATRNLAVTFFSSGASLVFPGMEPEPIVNKPDVTAPGAQVYSCIPPEARPDGMFAYTYMDGTSMACPHVAGVAALLMSANPDASATDVLKALKETAVHPLGEARRPDNRWGYGMVQPLAALKLIELA